MMLGEKTKNGCRRKRRDLTAAAGEEADGICFFSQSDLTAD
jgi:hypothetical protein